MNNSLITYISEKYNVEIANIRQELLDKKCVTNDTYENSIRVLLFANSSYKGKYNATDLCMSINDESIDIMYYYQMEVAMINEKLRVGENGIDYIIMLDTDETSENKIEVSFDDKYLVSCPPSKLIEMVAREGNILKAQGRVISISVEDQSDEGMANAVNCILNQIAEIKKENINSSIELHYYNHGGFRDLIVYLESMLSLFRYDPYVMINKYVTRYVSRTVAELTEGGYGVDEFVSGITEFRNYCRVDSLMRFYNGIENKKTRALLGDLKKISFGIQMVEMDSFEKGLQGLRRFKKTDLEGKDIKSRYLARFFDEIKAGFPFLSKEGPDYYLDMMEWCLENGYYQQLLTLIESKTPKLLHDIKAFNVRFPEGIDSCDYNKLFIDKFLQNLNTKDNSENLVDFCRIKSPNIAELKNGNKEMCVDGKAFLVLFWLLKQRRNKSNHMEIIEEEQYQGRGYSSKLINEMIAQIVYYYYKDRSVVIKRDTRGDITCVDIDGQRILDIISQIGNEEKRVIKKAVFDENALKGFVRIYIDYLIKLKSNGNVLYEAVAEPTVHNLKVNDINKWLLTDVVFKNETTEYRFRLLENKNISGQFSPEVLENDLKNRIISDSGEESGEDKEIAEIHAKLKELEVLKTTVLQKLQDNIETRRAIQTDVAKPENRNNSDYCDRKNEELSELERRGIVLCRVMRKMSNKTKKKHYWLEVIGIVEEE